MFPLISLTTQFLLIALVVTAVVLGATVAILYMRSRRAEEQQGLSASEHRELQLRDREIAAIRERIEEMYLMQQQGSSTQHAVINQRLEQLQQNLNARSRQIEGLQSQLRYEMQQREAEVAELRTQVREAVEALRAASLPQPSPPPALPAHQPAAEPEPDEAAHPVAESQQALAGADGHRLAEAVAGSATERAAAPGGWPRSPEPAPTARPEASPVQPVEEPHYTWCAIDFELGHAPEGPASDGAERGDAPQAPFPAVSSPEGSHPTHASAPSAPARDGQDRFHEAGRSSDDTGRITEVVQWTSLSELPPAEAGAPAQGAAPGEPTGPPAGIGRDGAGGDGLFSGHAPEPAPSLEDGEDLTVLPMIDAERQSELYSLGICTVEQLARLSRHEAHRIAEAIEGVTAAEIMNEWIFAAQTVLFERHQSAMRARWQ